MSAQAEISETRFLTRTGFLEAQKGNLLMNRSFEPGAPSLEGGISLCVPEIGGNEWKYVKECLDTGWVSSAGAFVNRFEREVAARAGMGHAVATVNGTAALHIALLVAGVQPGDEVLVSTLTFIAPVNAIRYVGAWPVLMDADPEYWQMDPQKLHDFLEKECNWEHGELRNRATHRRVRAILPVHILGHPCDMDPILEVARQYNLVVIEDATECLGALYKGRPVGSLGDIACYSFNGNKIITTGGGGMIVTDNEGWAKKARYLSTQAKDDPSEYIHNEIGYNYRLPNVLAAIGCAQLERLDEHIAAKRRIAKYYTQAFAEVAGISPMREAPWARSVFWMYTIAVEAERFGQDRHSLMRHLWSQKIECRPLWQPIHLNRPYRNALAYHCEVAEQLHQKCLSLPCSVGLSSSENDHVIEMIKTRARTGN
jgi:perosamine synthetase